MKNALYWTAVLLGLLLVYVFYKISTKSEDFRIENFEGATSVPRVSDDFNEITDPNVMFNEKFPGYASDSSNNKLHVYLSAFSKKTNTNPVADVYSKTNMIWRSMVGNGDFEVRKENAITLPESLYTESNDLKGLDMKGIILEGPASEQFNVSGQLPSCTIVMFMSWNNIFDSGYSQVKLFEMFAESPNHVSWSIVKKNATTARVEVVLGQYSTVYSWDVPISTLVSNGSYTIYALTFNATTKEIMMYIGTSGLYKKTLSSVPNVKLANTRVLINSDKTLDATLRAFAFLKNIAFTQNDIIKLNDYFVSASGGSLAILSEAQRLINEAEERRTLVESQLDQSQSNVDDLNQRLNQCLASNASLAQTSAQTGPVNRWKISMNFPTDGISTDALKRCSALSLKDFKDAQESSPLETQIPADLATTYSSRKPFTDYDIHNPTKPVLLRNQRVVDTTPTVPSVAPSPSNITTPTNSGSTTIASSDNDFWRLLLNLGRSASPSNASPPRTSTAYDDLRSSVVGDRTQPGPAATLFGTPPANTTSSSSQGNGSATPRVANPPVEERSLWRFFQEYYM
jgi:hypothetical protein